MELTVDVEARTVYLFPSRKESADSSLSDLGLAESETAPATSNQTSAIVYASCELTIPPLDGRSPSSSSSQGRRRLKSLTMSLVGRETISFPSGRFEQNDTADVEKSIEEALLDPQGLEPGKTYRFERSFLVDHASTPYQRSKWGRNVIKVVAKATFHGLFSKTLTASKRVYLVDCESDTGNEMLSYEKFIRRQADSIGPYILDARSHLFIVGGYLRFGFELLAPPPGLQYVGSRAFVVQSCELRSRRSKQGYVEKVPPQRVCILALSRQDVEQSIAKLRTDGGSAFEPGWQGDRDGSGGLRFESLARLPNDDVIRPSTASGNDAAIRFSHSLEFELDYIDGEEGKPPNKANKVTIVAGQKVKRFRITWPVHINSCVCRWGSMTLPPYACEDPAKHEGDDRGASSGAHRTEKGEVPAVICDEQCEPCTCIEPLDSILEFEKGTLQQQQNDMLEVDSGYGERPRCWEEQHKSEPRPSWSSSSVMVMEE
ncbi:hypothetical protein ACQY0O_008297 [Thecaphora frezii]